MARKKGSALAQAARLLGHKGGKRGGPARAHILTDKEKSDIARQGGEAKARNAKGS